MADYLQLLENPRRRGRRGRNPAGFDEFGNPIYFGGLNPRRRRKRRNPMARALAMPKTVREWTQGVDLMDAGAAVGGLAMSTMLPGIFVKTTDTVWQKTMKMFASFGCAVGAGALGKAVISERAGKAAIIGGLAGTAAMAIGMFTGFTIGQPRRLGMTTHGRISEANPVPTRGELPVSIIQP